MLRGQKDLWNCFFFFSNQGLDPYKRLDAHDINKVCNTLYANHLPEIEEDMQTPSTVLDPTRPHIDDSMKDSMMS